MGGLGAVSVVLWRNHDGELQSHASTYTDAVGQFRLQGVTEGRWTVRALEAEAAVDLRLAEEKHITLRVRRPAGVISGRVVDADKNPAPDVFVAAVLESDDPTDVARGLWRARAHRDSAITTEEGAFEIRGLREGRYTLVAGRPDDTETVEGGVRTGDRVELVLREGSYLSGTVVHGDGTPAPQFTILLSGAKGGFRSERFFDRSGRWRIEGLSADAYVLDVRADASSARRRLDLTDNRSQTDVQLVLNPPATIRGRFVDVDTGNGVAGVGVMPDSEGGPPFPGEIGAGSGANGRFEVRAPPGRIDLYFAGPGTGYLPGCRLHSVVLRPGEVRDLPPVELMAGTPSGIEWGLTIAGADEPHAIDHPLVVGTVTPNSIAHRAGLRAGDVIETANDMNVTGILHQRFPGILSGARTIALGLADGRKMHLAP